MEEGDLEDHDISKKVDQSPSSPESPDSLDPPFHGFEENEVKGRIEIIENDDKEIRVIRKQTPPIKSLRPYSVSSASSFSSTSSPDTSTLPFHGFEETEIPGGIEIIEIDDEELKVIRKPTPPRQSQLPSSTSSSSSSSTSLPGPSTPQFHGFGKETEIPEIEIIDY